MDYVPTAYDSNYCGNTESWPSSAFSTITNTWNTGNPTAATNWANWCGWSADPALVNVTSFSSNLIQTCNSVSTYQPKIFGGWKLFGLHYQNVTKSFVNVPTHSQVEVNVNIFFVDSWDIPEKAYVTLDHSDILIKEPTDWNSWSGTFPINYCG